MKQKAREKILNVLSTLIGSAILLALGYGYMRFMSALILWLGI